MTYILELPRLCYNALMQKPKRTKQQRHGDQGVKLFDFNLPSNEIIDHLFTELPQQDDFGLDGIVQVFTNGEHTGQLYTVQVKSVQELRANKKGELTFCLGVRAASFLIEVLKEPAILIVCDLKNKVVYWHNIQTNEKTLDEYRQVRERRKTQLKIILNENRTLPESEGDLNEYIRYAASQINKREEAQRISSGSLETAISEIKSYEEKVISLKGYDIYYGTDLPEDIRKKVVFRVTDQQAGKIINYVINDHLSQEDLIKINMRLVFPETDSGNQKENELEEVLNKKRDFIEISGDYIKHVKIFTETRIITDAKENPYLMLQIGVPTIEVEIFIKSNISNNEIKMKTDMWFSTDGSILLDSSRLDNQPLIIKMRFSPQTNDSFFNYSLNLTKFNNVRDAFSYLNLIEEIKKSGAEGYSYIAGIRSTLFSFGTNNTNEIVEEDPNFQFFLRLAFIQEKTGIVIPCPLPPSGGFSNNMQKLVAMVYNLIRYGMASFDDFIDIHSNLHEISELERKMEIGSGIIFETLLDYSLLGFPIKIPDNKVIIQGIVSNLWEDNGLLRLKIGNVKIFLDEI
jgi:hypothetical protein